MTTEDALVAGVWVDYYCPNADDTPAIVFINSSFSPALPSDSGTSGEQDTQTTCQHTYSSEVQREATCTEPGHMLFTCTQCGHSYVELIDATGHDWVVVGSVPEVLDEDGNVVEKGYDELECSKCGTISRDYGDGPVETDLFDALGDFLSDGITWALDKLTELADSFSSITETFRSYVEKVKGYVGVFPAFFGAFMAIIPEELSAILWLAVVGLVVLAVWHKWTS